MSSLSPLSPVERFRISKEVFIKTISDLETQIHYVTLVRAEHLSLTQQEAIAQKCIAKIKKFINGRFENYQELMKNWNTLKGKIEQFRISNVEDFDPRKSQSEKDFIIIARGASIGYLHFLRSSCNLPSAPQISTPLAAGSSSSSSASDPKKSQFEKDFVIIARYASIAYRRYLQLVCNLPVKPLASESAALGSSSYD